MKDCPNPEEPDEVPAVLPDDPLVEILSRVPFRSLCRFKCVSKCWRDLIANPIHRCKLPQTLAGLFYEIQNRRDPDGDDGIRSHGWVGFVSLLGRSSMPPADPFFSFLRTKLPGSECVRIMDTCHGLLLLDRGGYEFDSIPSYVVCNPATKQWLAVPDIGWTPSPCNAVHLIFCPGMSSDFHLLQFNDDAFTSVTSVQTYSSKTGAWTHSESSWSLEEKQAPCERWRYESYSLEPERKRAVVNGMLYLICDSLGEGPPVLDGDHIIAADVEGKTRKFIPVPFRMSKDKCSILSDCVGQSQELLHYVNHEELEYYSNNDGPAEAYSSEYNDDDVEYELSVWILPEGDTQELVLKHTVSFLHLFGEKSCKAGTDCNVVAIHPDRDVIIFKWYDDKLISYDMDTAEVCALYSTVSDSFGFSSYVPYFSELAALTNKY